MKLGLLSDIHSDLTSLGKALALLDQEGVDQLLCLGDAVESGRPHAEAVIAILRERFIPNVRGNHEHFMLGNQAWLRKNAEPDNPKLLKPETIEYLQHLPETRRYTWEGKRIVINHGTLWTLFPNSPTRFFDRITAMAEADVLLLGHTHQMMRVQYQQTAIFNPGAISAVHGGSHCATLSLPDLQFTVFDVQTGQVIPLETTVPAAPTQD